MPFVYCDHNFIVTASDGPDQYKDHLRQLVTSCMVTFVLSPTHWVEMAEDANAVRGTSTAAFADSLQSRWLFERRTVQRKEIADAFFRFALIPYEPSRTVTDVQGVIADLGGQAAYRESRAFVTHLRDVGPNHPLNESLRQADDDNRANRDRFQAGKLTPSILRNIEQLYVRQLLPASTPAGIAIDQGTKDQFLESYQLTDFPSLALETMAMHDNWRNNRQLNRNNFIDQQHLMALPYVDLFLTDDGSLTSLIRRIATSVPFRIATILTKAEFDRVCGLRFVRVHNTE